VPAGDRDWLEDRIRGCLAFGALGDVAGEPFEQLTRAEVAAHGDPLARVWGEGSGGPEGLGVTDDTGQLEALSRVLVASRGELTVEAWHAALVDWFRGSPTAEKAGPTTRAALEGRALEPARAADDRLGVTNGSAMRAAPCGLVHPGDPERAVRLAWLTSRITHDTQVAAAAAGAIAAGVATALRSGCGAEEVTEACVLGAALGNGLGVREGRCVALPRVSDRIELAIDQARAARDLDGALERSGLDPLDEALGRIEAAVGTSMLAFESVPAAVGVFAATGGDPFETVRAAVRIGGDTDTIAAMAGALAGALHGYAAHEPDDRAVLDLVLPDTLAELVPGLADLAARR
jgi:ADP-ribosylglycohydrolase